MQELGHLGRPSYTDQVYFYHLVLRVRGQGSNYHCRKGCHTLEPLTLGWSCSSLGRRQLFPVEPVLGTTSERALQKAAWPRGGLDTALFSIRTQRRFQKQHLVEKKSHTQDL